MRYQPPNAGVENPTTRSQALKKAIDEVQSHDDALFWFVCFVCPSLMTMIMGIMIFVWTDHALGVAIALSVALFYSVVQASRVVMNLAAAAMN